MFIDERTIVVAGGNGGDGIIHWRREKYVPKGGPDGGNGGDGGDAYILATRSLSALGVYKNMKTYAAQDGMSGGGALRSGKRGDDMVLKVPVGAVVTNKDTKERFELLEENAKVLVAAGGRGGLGNAYFKSSVNTTPMKATPGTEGQKYTFHIDLHIIADVGLIGLPNAGKSTLLNTLTNAHSKVGAYPFTTLEPNLGEFHGHTLADIPGLIENAAQGRGLGHKFLKHITRTRMLVHLISTEQKDVRGAYETIRKELLSYDPSLGEKEEIILLTKTDLITPQEVERKLKELPEGAISYSMIDDTKITTFSQMLSKKLQSI